MKYLIAVLLLVSLTGCLPSVRPGTKQEKKSESIKVEHRIPVVKQDAKGKLVVSYETLKVEQESEGAKSEAPKLTLWEKIKKWIIGLTALKALTLVLGVSFPVGGIFLSIWRTLTQVVRAIHDSKAVKDDNELEIGLKNRTGPVSRGVINFIRTWL